VLPRRRVVERTIGWLEKFRRLWKNCERKIHNTLQMTVLAFISSLLKNTEQALSMISVICVNLYRHLWRNLWTVKKCLLTIPPQYPIIFLIQRRRKPKSGLETQKPRVLWQK
jgi:hypothetical protein